jgi:small subunit ribosomal protein S11
MAYVKKTKKSKKSVESAVVHIKSTFNNTIVSVSTPDGDVIASGSGGRLGFKGSRKGTPFAATQIATNVAREIKDLGVKRVEVNRQGPGAGGDSAIRAISAAGLDVQVLRDVTPLPHNGCRPPKKRRI